MNETNSKVVSPFYSVDGLPWAIGGRHRPLRRRPRLPQRRLPRHSADAELEGRWLRRHRHADLAKGDPGGTITGTSMTCRWPIPRPDQR